MIQNEGQCKYYMSYEERYQRAKKILHYLKQISMPPTRPIWVGHDGHFRIGYSGDLVDFLENLKINTRS